MIHFRYLHNILFSTRVDELLYLAIEIMNSSSENGNYIDDHV